MSCKLTELLLFDIVWLWQSLSVCTKQNVFFGVVFTVASLLGAGWVEVCFCASHKSHKSKGVRRVFETHAVTTMEGVF